MAVQAPNTEAALRELRSLGEELANEIGLEAVDASGQLIEAAYKAAVPYGRIGLENAIHLREAIGRKTGVRSDGRGVFCVVGPRTVQGGRSAAPQGLWIEEGTDEREHKSGHPTGHVEAMHILADVSEALSGAAEAKFFEVLNRRLSGR